MIQPIRYCIFVDLFENPAIQCKRSLVSNVNGFRLKPISLESDCKDISEDRNIRSDVLQNITYELLKCCAFLRNNSREVLLV